MDIRPTVSLKLTTFPFSYIFTVLEKGYNSRYNLFKNLVLIKITMKIGLVMKVLYQVSMLFLIVVFMFSDIWSLCNLIPFNGSYLVIEVVSTHLKLVWSKNGHAK